MLAAAGQLRLGEPVRCLGGEVVCADVDAVARRVVGLLDHSGDAAVRDGEDAVRARVVDLVGADGRTGVEQRLKRRRVVEVVPVQDDEVVVEMGSSLGGGVGGAQPLGLLGVRDGDPPIRLSEMLAHVLAPVADDEDEFVGPRANGGIDGVGTQRPVRDGEHRLRDGVGQGPHPGSLPGGQDDDLHTRPAARVRKGPPTPVTVAPAAAEPVAGEQATPRFPSGRGAALAEPAVELRSPRSGSAARRRLVRSWARCLRYRI